MAALSQLLGVDQWSWLHFRLGCWMLIGDEKKYYQWSSSMYSTECNMYDVIWCNVEFLLCVWTCEQSKLVDPYKTKELFYSSCRCQTMPNSAMASTCLAGRFEQMPATTSTMTILQTGNGLRNTAASQLDLRYASDFFPKNVWFRQTPWWCHDLSPLTFCFLLGGSEPGGHQLGPWWDPGTQAMPRPGSSSWGDASLGVPSSTWELL